MAFLISLLAILEPSVFSIKGVGRESQRHDLRLSQLADAGLQLRRQQCLEALLFLQSNQTILHAQRIDSNQQHSHRRHHADQQQNPGFERAGMANDVDDRQDKQQQRRRHQEEMERRMHPGVVRVGLRKFFGHRVSLL